MSTISINANGGPVRVVQASVADAISNRTIMATRLRITERGRRVLAALVALPIVVAVVIAVLSGGTALASLDEGGAPVTFETINVMPGDTLWSLAGEIAPAADPRDVIDAIVSLNALPSSAIVPGQTLSIPAEYTK